jgi:hypothetical protein
MEGPALAGSSAAAPIAGGRTWHVAALPLRGAPLGDGRSGVLEYPTPALRSARRAALW